MPWAFMYPAKEIKESDESEKKDRMGRFVEVDVKRRAVDKIPAGASSFLSF
jgi:hypothetical protein